MNAFLECYSLWDFGNFTRLIVMFITDRVNSEFNSTESR